MRRLWWVLALLAAGAGLLWLFGRAPTAYALEEECRLYHEERSKEYAFLSRKVARLEAALLRGAEPDPELADLRIRLEDLSRSHRRVRRRGWEVVLIPEGADRPAPEDFLLVGSFDPSGPDDPPTLRRTMEIWLAARGGLARLIYGLGLSP
ncbi:MAG: hypothetical protein ACYTGV_04355 [Planctomycetota bacterium]